MNFLKHIVDHVVDDVVDVLTPPVHPTEPVRSIVGHIVNVLAPPVQPPVQSIPTLDDFPDDFVFGTGTAAYQVEGAAIDGGRGLSVWDGFALRTPGKIIDGTNGNIASDMYHRYKEDIRKMKNMGFDAYRFSISWSRILPGGRASAGVNQEGIDYYNRIIDTVIENGMKPYATLFHWDTPIWLEKEYDGFLDNKIVNDFREYAELCFWKFGDRVKWWATINEPWTYAVNGYVKGIFPPGKVSCPPDRVLKNLPAHRSVQIEDRTMPLTQPSYDESHTKFEPEKEVYTVGRNLLLAHAEAVHSYRTKFKGTQGGEIGIVLNSNWHEPYDKCSLLDRDKKAAEKALDFMLGWFMEPILFGEYPKSMRESIPSDNLAGFSDAEITTRLRGSVDFVGLNYYTANYVRHLNLLEELALGCQNGYHKDLKVEFLNEKGKKLIGDESGSTWLNIVPWGIYELLKHMAGKYKDFLPPIYITENGVSEKSNYKLTAKQACADPTRTKYHQDHLRNIKKAMDDFKDALEVKGYFFWSWCDGFEWAEGYKARFGLTCVDFLSGETRHYKDSAVWIVKFLKKNALKRRVAENDDAEIWANKKRAGDGGAIVAV